MSSLQMVAVGQKQQQKSPRGQQQDVQIGFQQQQQQQRQRPRQPQPIRPFGSLFRNKLSLLKIYFLSIFIIIVCVVICIDVCLPFYKYIHNVVKTKKVGSVYQIVLNIMRVVTILMVVFLIFKFTTRGLIPGFFFRFRIRDTNSYIYRFFGQQDPCINQRRRTF